MLKKEIKGKYEKRNLLKINSLIFSCFPLKTCVNSPSRYEERPVSQRLAGRFLLSVFLLSSARYRFSRSGHG